MLVAVNAEPSGTSARGKNAELINPPGKNERNMAKYVPNATTIFDFTRRAMPWPQPKSLSNDDTLTYYNRSGKARTAYDQERSFGAYIIYELPVGRGQRFMTVGTRTGSGSGFGFSAFLSASLALSASSAILTSSARSWGGSAGRLHPPAATASEPTFSRVICVRGE